MHETTEAKVVIGIQARSTSTRLPNKVFARLGDRTVLEHVVASAKEACAYLNRYRNKSGFVTSFYVLCPQLDRIASECAGQFNIIQGPEHDVLTRYHHMVTATGADYIVRITADCPLLPSYLISKHVKIAVINQYDYLSNVHESVRTQVDGFDVEVISRRMLMHAMIHAVEDSDREHVTTYIRKNPPKWAKIGHVIGYLPLQNIKLSIDTQEDLERVRKHYEEIQNSIAKAEELHGPRSVHRV